MSPAQSNSQILGRSLESLRGVGPTLLQRLQRLGLQTVDDLLFTLPSRYEDRRTLRSISQLQVGAQEIFRALIVSSGETQTNKGRRLYEVLVGDGSGQQVALRWFHYRLAAMRQQYQAGRHLYVIGEVKRFGHLREIHHPEIEFIDDLQKKSDLVGHILPVYPLTEGLTQRSARKLWHSACTLYAREVVSAIPPDIIAKHALLPLGQALQEVHAPDDASNFIALNEGRSPARRTLAFDEFFFLELGLALKRQGMALETGIAFTITHRFTKPLAQQLPYKLTAAQRRVLGEIRDDLLRPQPMNRLLQGDVGSGKTIVALMTALLAIENDCQVALLAPTEILADQHYRQFAPWMKQLRLRCALLTGSTGAKERREIIAATQDGTIHLLVGTHAVLQEGVEFQRLGLGIVDEQHRFGVRQRSQLRRKGVSPHILVMTATPIPRTLSLTLYGDLALSVIDELPPGRTPIVTQVFSEAGRGRVYEMIRRELSRGRQAYIVYPLVEESEKVDLLDAESGAGRLQSAIFPDFKVGLLHGRMRGEEKEAVMTAFAGGEIQLLVATTVIEVGIDVPNASIMVIEHAERFGLAQLHQLRGRVGRGAAESHCILGKGRQCGQEGEDRLAVLARTNDGFQVAEADLKIRGPGEFLGTKQSGIPDLRVADLLRDGHILEEARTAAFALVEQPDFLKSDAYALTRQELRARWGNRLELASIG
ncbi:MAG: ATP-dependent DNA helicase RecG [Desulfuromonadales bacterium]|nr:ATP-dependent DNA helicase RecG [Desulfuromonadales bacterium]